MDVVEQHRLLRRRLSTGLSSAAGSGWAGVDGRIGAGGGGGGWRGEEEWGRGKGVVRDPSLLAGVFLTGDAVVERVAPQHGDAASALQQTGEA